jgi:hypothetical protein
MKSLVRDRAFLGKEAIERLTISPDINAMDSLVTQRQEIERGLAAAASMIEDRDFRAGLRNGFEGVEDLGEMGRRASLRVLDAGAKSSPGLMDRRAIRAGLDEFARQELDL